MKRYSITVNGKMYDVMVEELAAGAPAPLTAPAAAPAPAPVAAAPVSAPAPAPVSAPAPAPVKAAAPAAGSITVKSPMPGTIVDIKVSAGQKVKSGDLLCILEAMKMENEILAPSDGTVASVNVAKSASVNTGDLLVTIS